MRSVTIIGLGLTLLGALALAWRDLRAKPWTWDTLNAEPAVRRRWAWLGFPLIAVGTVLQIIGVALD